MENLKTKMKNTNYQKKRTNKLAIACFILGLVPIISFFIPLFNFIPYFSFVFFYLPILLSIIFGVISLIKIKRDKSLGGKTLSILGIIISVLTVLFVVISIILLAKALKNF